MEFHEIMNIFTDKGDEGKFPEVPPMKSTIEKPWLTHGRYHSHNGDPRPDGGEYFENMNRWWRYDRSQIKDESYWAIWDHMPRWDYAGYQMERENWEEPEKKFKNALTQVAEVLVKESAGDGSDRFSPKSWTVAIENLSSLAELLDKHTHNGDGTGFFNAYQKIDVPDGPFRGSAAGVYANILYGFATRVQDLANQTFKYQEELDNGLSKLEEYTRKLRNQIKITTSDPKSGIQSVIDHWYHETSAGSERWLDHRHQFEILWRDESDKHGKTYGIVGDRLTDEYVNNHLHNLWKAHYQGILDEAKNLFEAMQSIYGGTLGKLNSIEDPISGSLDNGTENEDNKSGNDDDDWFKKYLEGLKGKDGEGPPGGDGGPDGGDWNWDDILGNPGSGGNHKPPPLSNAPPLPNNYPGPGNSGGNDGPNGASIPPPGYGDGVPDLSNTFPGADGLSDSNWSVNGAGGPGDTGPLGFNGPGTGVPGVGSPVNGFTSPDGGFDPPLDNNFPVGGGIVPPLGASGPGGSTGARRQQNGGPGLPTNFPVPSSLDLDPASGLPINPETGQPFPVDPDTGQPFNPDTGLPLNYDPATGQVSPIDPVTGLPVDTGGATAPPSDPGLPTNFPGAENVPLNPITGEPAELDPLSGIPYPIDPETGEPIRGGLDLGDLESPLPRMESSNLPGGLNYPGAGGGPPTSSPDSGNGAPGTADRSAMFSAPGGGGGALGQTGDGAGGAGGASSPFRMEGQGSPGMPPMMPPMGGMGGGGAGGGGGGGEGRERNRATWLSEDEKVWGTDKTRGKTVLGRPVPGEKKGTTRHEFIDAGADGSRTGTASNDDAGTRGRKRKPGVRNRRGDGQEQTRDGDGRRDRPSD